MGRPRLYLSASIANAPINARLRDALLPAYELVLPQEFTPDGSHVTLPRAIFDRCIEEMDRCDAAIVLLDALGVDCAMECGFLLARKKKVIAIAGSSVQFARHWMVKGALSAVVTFDPLVAETCRTDAILGQGEAPRGDGNGNGNGSGNANANAPVQAYVVKDWGEIAEVLGRVLY